MSLRRNALWNLAGAVVPLFAAAALIPYLLRQLGVEAFGVLTLIWALLGYFSLFDFGLGRALTQRVAQGLASDAGGAALPAMIKSGLLLVTATGGLGGAMLALAAGPLSTEVLKVSPSLQRDVFHALLIAALGVPVTTATVGLRGVLEAYEDFRDANLLRMLFGIGTFVLPALSVLLFGPSLVWMVFALMAARLLLVLAHWKLLQRRLAIDFSRARFRREDVRDLLSFGAWMTVSNILSPLMVTADRFLVSAVLGAMVVAYYAVPAELVARMLIVPAALTGALFPRLASLLTRDVPAARALYRRCVALVTAVLIPVCIALALSAHWGLSLWLGPAFADRAAPSLAILALGLLLNGVAFIPFAALQAAGRARTTARLHMLEALLYMPILWFALGTFGLAGAAVAWVCRVGLDLVLLLASVRRLVFVDEPPAPRMRHNFPSTEPQRTDTP